MTFIFLMSSIVTITLPRYLLIIIIIIIVTNYQHETVVGSVTNNSHVSVVRNISHCTLNKGRHKNTTSLNRNNPCDPCSSADEHTLLKSPCLTNVFIGTLELKFEGEENGDRKCVYENHVTIHLQHLSFNRVGHSY
jgi:hypothetical protein